MNDKFKKEALKEFSYIINENIPPEKLNYFFHKCGYEKFRYDGGNPIEYFYCRLIELNNYEKGLFHVAKILQLFINDNIFLSKFEEKLNYSERFNHILHDYGIHFNRNFKLSKKI